MNELSKFESKLVETLSSWLGNLVGGPISILSSIMEDSINYWKLKNRLKILDKAKKLYDLREISPEKVMPGTFRAALEKADYVDEENLSNKFAGLLCSLVDPSKKNIVHPAFSGILSELSFIEVSLLDFMRKCYLRACTIKESIAYHREYKVDISHFSIHMRGIAYEIANQFADESERPIHSLSEE